MSESEKLFEGERIEQVVCVLRGDVGDARLNDLLHRHDEVVVVARAKVGAIVADTGKKGVARRRQILDVMEGFVVTDAVDADDLVQKLRSEREKALAELLGQDHLFNEGDDDATD